MILLRPLRFLCVNPFFPQISLIDAQISQKFWETLDKLIQMTKKL